MAGILEENKIDLLRAEMVNIHHEQKIVELFDGNGIHYDRLVIATGSTPNRFGWKGQDLQGVQGLYSKQDLRALKRKVPPFNKRS